jgi:endonuclease/exonuclease/phosphatase family metal-dependent hydrolase
MVCADGSTCHRLAEVDLPTRGLSLAAVHIPCDDRPSGRAAALTAVVAEARRRRDEAFVIMGDFNAGRHRLDEAGATFTCTRRMGELAALGYRDAWRDRNATVREASWTSHTGAGFRIDHAFVSAPLAPRVSGCWYSHRERLSGLSDHSALVLELAEAATMAPCR